MHSWATALQPITSIDCGNEVLPKPKDRPDCIQQHLMSTRAIMTILALMVSMNQTRPQVKQSARAWLLAMLARVLYAMNRTGESISLITSHMLNITASGMVRGWDVFVNDFNPALQSFWHTYQAQLGPDGFTLSSLIMFLCLARTAKCAGPASRDVISRVLYGLLGTSAVFFERWVVEVQRAKVAEVPYL